MKTPEEYYNDVYGHQDDLGLPRPRRTYFDSLCHEYGFQTNNLRHTFNNKTMTTVNTLSAKTIQELLAGRCQEFDSTKAIKIVRKLWHRYIDVAVNSTWDAWAQIDAIIDSIEKKR